MSADPHPTHGPATGPLVKLDERLMDRGGSVPLGEVIDGLGQAGIGMTLLVLTLPALIPIPGPFGLIFGSIVAFLSAQLIFGARRLWLPEALRARALPTEGVRSMLAKALPWLQRAETWLKPRRLLPLTGRLGRAALGVPLILMGVALALPIPLGNVPPVASLVALSLGLMVRDGAAVLVGLALAAVAALWLALLAVFGAQAIDWLWTMLGW